MERTKKWPSRKTLRLNYHWRNEKQKYQIPFNFYIIVTLTPHSSLKSVWFLRGAQTAAEGYDLVTNWVKAMVLADLSRAWCSTMGNEIWLYLHAINFGASRLRQTANASLYHVTKFPLYLSITVHYFNTWISSYTQFFIHKNCFQPFFICSFSILRNSPLEAEVCRLPYTWCLNSLKLSVRPYVRTYVCSLADVKCHSPRYKLSPRQSV